MDPGLQPKRFPSFAGGHQEDQSCISAQGPKLSLMEELFADLI